MADIQSNIRVNIDTSDALASIKNLQRQISAFQKQMQASSAANASQAENLQRVLINDINATGKFAARMQTIKSTTESFTTSLEKNKLSMGEYFRYGASQTRAFSNVFSTEFNTIEKVARERVKTLQTQYISLGRDASGALKSISVRPLTLDMDSLATRQAIAAQKQQIFNQLLKQGSTNLLNFGKNTQWAGRQLMVGFTIPLSIFGTQAARTFMEIEEQSIRFRRVYGELFTPAEEADSMLEQLRELGLEFAKYGVAVKDTLALAADAAAMGKTGIDLTAQVAEASRLAVLGSVDNQQALETTISLTNAFGTAAEDLADKINFLNAVENQTVVSIEDLTIAIPKAGPVVKQLGGDVEDLAFFLTAMKEGGINASEGANALKSGLARIINPTAKATQMLAGFNINIQEIVQSNAGDIKQTVLDLATALDTLDPLNKARAIETLFGRFQFARLSTLFKNVIEEGNQASRVLELTNATTAELAQLSEKELSRVEESTTFKFRGAIEEFQSALAPIGEEFMKLVTPLIEFGTKVLNAFNNMSDGAKRMVVGILAVLGGVAPVALMTFGLLANGIANMIKGFVAVRSTVLGFGRDTTQLGAQIDYMTQEQLQAASVAASLDQTHMKLTQTFTSERSAVDGLTSAYSRAVQASQRLMVAPAPTTIAKKFASGGIVKGPGTGTSDSIIARVSNGEAIIPADSVKANPNMVKALIAGSIPGFRDGGLVKGYSNATIYLPESMNTAMGSTSGRGVASSQVASQIRAGGAAGMAPLMAAMAKQMGTSINDPKFKAEWMKVGDKFAETAATALENSGREFVKDLDLEEIVVPALKDAAQNIDVAGQKVDKALDNTLTQIRTASAVGTQSGSRGALGRVNLGGSYKGMSGQAQRFALGTGNDVFARNTVPSKSRGTKQLFQMTNVADSKFETATMAHVKRSTTTTVAKLKNQVKGYLGDVGDKIVKAATGGVVDGVNKAAKSSSPSQRAKQAGKNIADGAIQGVQEGQKQAAVAGAALADAVVSGTTGTQSRRVTSGVAKFDAKSGKYMSADKLAQQTASREKARMRIIDASTNKFRSFNGKLQGASFALSSVAGVASMFGGQVGEAAGQIFMLTAALSGVSSLLQAEFATTMIRNVSTTMTEIGGVGKLFKGGFKNIFANLGKVVTSVFGKFTRFIPVIGGVILAFGAVKLLFDLAEKQKEKIEGLGATANLTSDKLKKLGEILGVTVTEIDYKLRGVNASSQQSEAEKSQTQQLLENEDFAESYAQQITAISNATKDQAQRTLQALALQLQGAGFESSAINAVVNAISQKAGRTDLDLSFANVNVDGSQILPDVVALAQQSAEAYSKEFEKGYTTDMSGTVVRMTEAFKIQIEETSSTFKSIFDNLASGLDSGRLSAEEFSSKLEESVDYISAMPNAANLIDSLAEKMELTDTIKGLAETEDRLLAIQGKIAGLDVQPYVDAIAGAASPGADAEDIRFGNMARERLVELIKEEAAATAEANKLREEALKELNMQQAYEQGSTAIQNQIEEVKLQNAAYLELISAGFEAADAIKAVGDANFYEAYANSTSADERQKIIDDYAELINVIKQSPFYQAQQSGGGGGQKSVFQQAVDALKEQREEIGNSISAYSRLRKAGLSIGDAFAAAQDSTLAAALATTKVGTQKWEKLLSLIKQVNEAARQSKLLDLVVERKTDIALTRAFAEITPMLSKLGLTLSDMEQILGDPDLAQSFIDDLKDGEINSRNILYYINQIPAKKKVDLLFSLATPQGMESAFGEAFSRQMEAFGLEDRKVEAEFRAPIKAAQDAVAAAQDEVDAAQKSIDALQTTISDKQREIELSIDRPIEALNEQVSEIQRGIELNFERPISTLQEETSDLANDLALIDKVAEGINKKYDDQQKALDGIVEANAELVEQDRARLDVASAIADGDIAAAARAMRQASQEEARRAREKAAKAIEAAREKEIAGIRSQSGMTRAEIEQRQFEIAQQIYNLEEKREDKERQIRDIQDEIYTIEQSRLPLLDEILELEDQVYDIQQGQLLTAQTALEDAQRELDAINDAKQARLDAVQAEKDLWNDLQIEVDEARIQSNNYLTSLTDVKNMVDQIKAAWAGVGTVTASSIASISSGSGTPSISENNNNGGGSQEEPPSTGPGPIPPYNPGSGNYWKVIGGKWAAVPIPAKPSRSPGRGKYWSFDRDTGTWKSKAFVSATPSGGGGGAGSVLYRKSGGMVPKYFGAGGFARGTDTIPAMLTPGEFIVSRSAVKSFGTDGLKAINNGTYSSDSVYNYSVNVSVKSDANPDEIARAVMTQIKQVDAQRIRGNRF